MTTVQLHLTSFCQTQFPDVVITTLLLLHQLLIHSQLVYLLRRLDVGSDINLNSILLIGNLIQLFIPECSFKKLRVALRTWYIVFLKLSFICETTAFLPTYVLITFLKWSCCWWLVGSTLVHLSGVTGSVDRNVLHCLYSIHWLLTQYVVIRSCTLNLVLSLVWTCCARMLLRIRLTTISHDSTSTASTMASETECIGGWQEVIILLKIRGQLVVQIVEVVTHYI